MSRSDEISPQDQSYDQGYLQTIKQQICLNNHQLLELTYNDQKFYQKLKQLNDLGTQSILQTKFHQALIYLNQAQKVLQYAASCGKTIQRTLIITTLNNQAALYQRAWQLEKAASYIQAIIYNISSFFEKDEQFQFSQKILESNSIEFQNFRIYLWRKKLLALYYLQFCAVNSQNKKHQNAYNSASKANILLKQICIDCYRFQSYYLQKNNINPNNSQIKSSILKQLRNLKPLNKNKITFQSLLLKSINYIALYLRKIQNKPNTQEFNQIKQKFETYSIGHLMQINPIKLEHHQDKIDLQNQISQIQKTFKTVYLSIGHFILATQLRFISTQKYTLDQNQRKNSIQYKQSQNYHLYAIILAAKFLPCQSVYFDHIVNSFRNHYKIDLLQKAKEHLNLNTNFQFKQCFDEDLFQNQPLNNIINYKKQIKQQVQKFIQQSIQNVNIKQIQDSDSNNNELKTQISQEIKQDEIIKRSRESNNQIPNNDTRLTKKSKKSGISNKKDLKGSKKNLHKSQSKYQSHKSKNNEYNQRLSTQIQNNINTQGNCKQKNIKQLTKQKQKDNNSKINNNLRTSNKNDKSRSKSKKKKSDHFQFNKKAQIVNINININRQKSTQNKYLIGMKDNSQFKKNPDYIMSMNSKTKRSKSKRVSTHSQYQIQKFNEKPIKKLKNKQNLAQSKKNKKIQQQYGIINLKNKTRGIESFKPNTSHYRNSKSKQKSQQKKKFKTPQNLIKKLKSPKNSKNSVNPY